MKFIASKLLYIFFTSLLLINCETKTEKSELIVNTEVAEDDNSMFTDQDLTHETKALHTKLVNIAKKGIAFGHQDATAYGIGWKHSGFPSESDIKKLTGDHPAVIGFEIGDLEIGREMNLDSVNFNLMKKLIQEAHQNGSIITISWHANNPVTDGNSWDKTPAVSQILKDTEFKKKFEGYIEKVANFFLDLKDDNGKLIPIVFRPWHEMTGSWFWWGGENRTTEEYKQLFRETVELLRDKHNVHNLLYTYSPDKIYHNTEYLLNYPGDEWVDMLGIDIYDSGNHDYIKMTTNALELIKYIAAAKNKPFAFTETGREIIPENNWWTETFYEAVKNSGASYALVWRNASNDHHYAPFKGHNSAENFIEFVSNEDILLQKDIQQLYEFKEN